MGAWGSGPFDNDLAADEAAKFVRGAEERLPLGAEHLARCKRPPDVGDYQTYRALIELLVGAHQVGAFVNDGAWYAAQYILDVMTRDDTLASALVQIVKRRLKWVDGRVAESKKTGRKPKRLSKLKLPAWAKKR